MFTKKIMLLIFILSSVAVLVAGLSITILYRTALDENRDRLIETAKSQARLIEAIARFDLKSSGPDNSERAYLATLSQISDAHDRYEGFGVTGEFTLARREGDLIVFLLRHRHFDHEKPKPVLFNSSLAEPMRRALSGQSGWVVGLDYRAEKVLAAYEPVAVLDLGIVAKIDLSEIQAPYFKAGSIAAFLTVMLVAIGTVLTLRVTRPIIERISESEEQYRRTFEDSGVGMAANKLNGRFIRVNKAFCDMLGFSEQELLDKSVAEITFEEDLAMTLEARNSSAVQGRHLDTMEKRFVRNNGEVIWGLVNRSLIKDSAGQPHHFESQIQNITKRKLAEDKLRQSENRLTNAQALSQLGYFERDVASGNLYWSDITCRMYGLEPNAQISIEQFISFIHPNDRKRVKMAMEGFIDTGGTYSEEFRIVRSDGTERILLNNAIASASDQNGVTEYIGAVRDVTDERLREDLVLQAQKMEAVGQLTGGVAHDFNNLLAAIMSNAQLLELDLEGQDDLLAMASSIVGEAQRGAELTHRLLAFSRKQTLQPKSICLDELCEGMIDLLKRTLGETINIQIASKGELWNVMADPGQVESALLNLAINASHAMPDGGSIGILIGNISVTDPEWAQRWEGESGDYVALRVIDTGTGMPQAVLEQAFEPFFTTKGVGEGSGLGLSMVYGLAQQSGGFTTIESEEGKGTTVSIYLPKAKDEQIVATEHPSDAELQEGRGETILLVEDEAAVRDTTTKLLERLGYTVLVAEDGPDALTISSKADRIDLLLSDMVLPGGMNGIDIFNRACEQRPTLKCVFMSGYASLPDHHLPDGAEILSKPVSMDELAAKARQALDS